MRENREEASRALSPISLIISPCLFSLAHLAAKSVHDTILRCRINAAFRNQVERRIYAAEGVPEEICPAPLRRESGVVGLQIREFNMILSAQVMRSLIVVFFIAFVIVRCEVNAQDRPDQRPANTPRADLEILGNLFRGIAQISEHIQAKDLRSIHTDQITVSSAIDILGQKTSLDAEKRRSLQHALGVLNRKIVDTHRLADAGDQRGAEKVFTNEVLSALQTLKGCYPEDWINAAQALPEKIFARCIPKLWAVEAIRVRSVECA